MFDGTTLASKKTQRRKRDPKGTRVAILEAAGKLLAKDGPEGLSVSQVAQLAGVNRGTAYQHFPTREQLVEATTAWVSERLRRAVFGDVTPEQGAMPNAQDVAEHLYLVVLAALPVGIAAGGVGEGGVGLREAREHAGELTLPTGVVEGDQARGGHGPVAGLLDQDVAVGERGDLGQVGDDEDLGLLGEGRQAASDLHRCGAADPGVDLVEDEGRDRTGAGEAHLHGQHHPGELATRRSCSAGSSNANAGCETPTTAVSVARWGSWTMTAPVSGSTFLRSPLSTFSARYFASGSASGMAAATSAAALKATTMKFVEGL